MKIRVHRPIYGTPITFLDKYNPKQFEIVSFRKGEDGKDLVFTREMETWFNDQIKKKSNLTFVSLFDIDCRDDKECRRKSEWENYLRKNNDKKDKEPINYFFPIRWQISGNQRAKVNNRIWRDRTMPIFLEMYNDGLHLYNLFFVQDENYSTGQGHIVKQLIL